MTAGHPGQEPQGRPVITGRELYTLARCERRLWLDHHLPGAARAETEFERELWERGRDHRRRVRDSVAGRVGPLWRPGQPLAPAAAETLRLLRETRAPLDQPVLLAPDGSHAAIPDFLYWDGSDLVVCDTRLAGSVEGKPEIPLRLSLAAELLEQTAGLTPARLEVAGGRGHAIPVTRLPRETVVAAVGRALALTAPDAPEPVLLLSHSDCESCPYYGRCWERAERERWVHVLPAVRRTHVPALEALGIRTMEDLASRPPESLLEVRGLGKQGAAMVHEARAFLTGEPQWIAPPPLPPGRPCVWFDLETDTEDEKHGVHVYLWGFAVEPGSGATEHSCVLSGHGEDRDEETWRRFLGEAARVFARWPDALWVHYSNFEKTWVKKYVERWGDPSGVAARLLERLFDLHTEGVMKSVRLPIRSYGIKSVAGHLGFSWRNAGAGSQWSLVQYRRAQRASGPDERERLIAEIVEYNADDLLAMRAVWNWLEANAPRPVATT